MRKTLGLTLLALCLSIRISAHAEDQAGRIKEAVQKSTLDQPGTKPFHLKAVLAPSYDATTIQVGLARLKSGGILRLSGDVRSGARSFTRST